MSATQVGDAKQEECALLFLPLPSTDAGKSVWDLAQQGIHTALPRISDVFSAEHGYTHVAVDCCGVRDTRADSIPLTCDDVEPGERFAIHVTRGCNGIGRKALTSWDNETPPRAYGRLPLRHLAGLGVSCETFCKEVNQLLARGAKYGELRYWTLGLLYPTDAVCTDVVTQCLPVALRKRIHNSLKQKYLLLIPAVSNRFLWTDTYLISPNGYAIALGLKHGRHITGPNQPLTANLQLFDT